MLPGINEIKQKQYMTDIFEGYNHTVNCADNQFYEMENISSDSYPAMSARKKREYLKDAKNARGMIYADGLILIDGDDVFINGVAMNDVEVTAGEKQLIKMGKYVYIFPDKKYTTIDESETGYIDVNASSEMSYITVEPCTYEGASITYVTTEPETPEEGKYWLDGKTLKIYSTTYGSWMPVATSYVRLAKKSYPEKNIDTRFWENNDIKAGDAINVSGFTDKELNGIKYIYNSADGYIVIESPCKTIEQRYPEIEFKRSVPAAFTYDDKDFRDYAIESNNRMWICNSEKHEIYASKLGDPSNWECYIGLVSDSYAVTVASFGDFTGAINYNGNPVFFKEDRIIIISGTQPSEYTLDEIMAPGVQKGCSKSIVNCKGVIYYKSREGVMAWSGGLPVNISNALGEFYIRAYAGATMNKLYYSMEDSNGNFKLCVYDIAKNIWTLEDTTGIKYFAPDGTGGMYFINDGKLYVIKPKEGYSACPNLAVTINGQQVRLCPGMFCPGQIFGQESMEQVTWTATTGDWLCEFPDKKYVSKISVRTQVEENMLVEVMYDGDGVWEPIANINKTSKRSISIPIRIRRCDYFKLRFSGTGDFKIYSIARSVERGSEV